MEENYKQFPYKTYGAKHVLEDGDLVAVHGRVELRPKVYSVIFIFRFVEKRIIESWEASQEELKTHRIKMGYFNTTESIP